MQLDKYDQSLKDYLSAIGLTATQEQQVDKAIEGILELALVSFPEADVYAQGSFATDTMAKPLTSHQGGGTAGEFDVDLAIERDWGDAQNALDELAEAVKDDDTFGDLEIDNTKNTCVRIKYPEDKTGVAFHIDLVPTKIQSGEGRTVPDREAGEWKPSDTKLFADWFNQKADEQPGLRQIAVILKRLRDLASMNDDIKSIMILTLLVKNAFYDTGSIMGNLISSLEGILDQLPESDSAPRIDNPVNVGENLSDGLNDYSAARSFFVDTKNSLSNALASDDTTALKVLFGSGFSYSDTVEAKYSLSYKTTIAPISTPTRAYGACDAKTD